MDDAQLMRLVTLGLAVHWTAHTDPEAEAMTFGDLFAIAERFGEYVENGITGTEGH